MNRLQHLTSLMVTAQINLDAIGRGRRVALATRDRQGLLMLDVLASQQHENLSLLGARLVQHPAANDATTIPGAA